MWGTDFLTNKQFTNFFQRRERSGQESSCFAPNFPSEVLQVCSPSHLDGQSSRLEAPPPIALAVCHQDGCFLSWCDLETGHKDAQSGFSLLPKDHFLALALAIALDIFSRSGWSDSLGVCAFPLQLCSVVWVT